MIFDNTGYPELGSNAGRAVLGRNGRFYGLEITNINLIGPP